MDEVIEYPLQKICWGYDKVTGLYAGPTYADLSIMDLKVQGEVVYLYPAYTTLEPPPEVGENQQLRWKGEGWIIEDKPVIEPKPAEMTFVYFLEQFSEDEQLAITQAFMGDDPLLRLFYNKAFLKNYVYVADNDTKRALEQLVELGVISQTKADEILNLKA